MKYEDESLLLIEAMTEHTYCNEPTEENLDKLIEKINDLLEDIIKRQDEFRR